MLTCNGRTASGLGGCCCGALLALLLVRRLRLLDLVRWLFLLLLGMVAGGCVCSCGCSIEL